jgi:hypothetical protein
MIQSGCSLSFMNETFFGAQVLGKTRGQKLERYSSLELGVLGLVDYAHATSAELL